MHGGLGNQMFQYAFMHTLKYRYPDANIYAHIDCYDHHNGFELTQIFTGIHLNVLPRNMEFVIPSKSNFSKIKRKLGGCLGKKASAHYFEDKYGFHADVYDQKKHAYFEGYWQSEKYFKQYADEIRRKFTFTSNKMPLKIEAVKKNIENTLSCSIHVRRGDYVTWASSVLGGICTVEYYAEAMKKMREMHPGVKFFIFSDDVPWSKEHFNLSDCEVVDAIEKKEDSFWDMYLIGICQHHIMANSSFSWWGVWLGNNDEKNTTISPGHWFTEKVTYNADDIICPNWIKVSL